MGLETRQFAGVSDDNKDHNFVNELHCIKFLKIQHVEHSLYTVRFYIPDISMITTVHYMIRS